MSKNLILCFASAIIGGALFWLVAGREPASPAPASSTSPIAAPGSATRHPQSSSDTARPDHGAHGGDRPAASSARAAELEAFADGLRDKVVVNYGTVEEIGGKMASIMGSRAELRQLRKIPADQRTPEQSQRLLDLEREHAASLGMLPEIAGFQDDPELYGSFYASLVRDAAALDAPKTAAVRDYMKQRGEIMVSAGVNTANEPTDPALAGPWEERRDAFNRDTAKGVAALIGDDEARRIGFTPGFLELMEQDFDKAD